jgi:hypothetical protein
VSSTAFRKEKQVANFGPQLWIPRFLREGSCATLQSQMSARSAPLSLVVKRRLLSADVEEARDRLKLVMSDAIAQSGLFQDEAEGRLSLFLAHLWDDFEPVLNKLPVQRDASKLGLSGIIPVPQPRPADLGLVHESKKSKAGRPRKDGSTQVEERPAI